MPERYIHKNLQQVADSAPDLGAADWQQSRFASQDFASTDIGFTHHRFLPGKRQGFAHRHEQAEEFYVVLSGSGRLKLDDDILDLAPLDAFRVAPQVLRTWEAGPDGLEVLAFGARVDGDEAVVPSDAEIVSGWWTD
ncbi:MAG: cupin domain-containing protein [Solirubrobacterales bacterium]|nr:cupin domain-containing protein [Solirubrobacterales bacterium]